MIKENKTKTDINQVYDSQDRWWRHPRWRHLHGLNIGKRARYKKAQRSYSVALALTTLCLNGTGPCVDLMEVIMGGIPLFPHVNTASTIFSINLQYITKPHCEWDTFIVLISWMLP